MYRVNGTIKGDTCIVINDCVVCILLSYQATSEKPFAEVTCVVGIYWNLLNNFELVQISFDIESFAAGPSIEALSLLKRAELTRVAKHYKLSITSAMKKGEIQQLIITYLRDEKLISDKESELPTDNSNTLRRLEIEERAKERETEIKLRVAAEGKGVRNATQIEGTRGIPSDPSNTAYVCGSSI